MCRQKECPECHLLVLAHVAVCTSNRCHHVFDESIPHVATIGRTYPAGVDPDRWFRSTDSTGEGV